MELGHSITYYRKKARLTQKELANMVGIHKNYLSGIENEHIKPHLKLVSQIADCLGIKINALLKK